MNGPSEEHFRPMAQGHVSALGLSDTSDLSKPSSLILNSNPACIPGMGSLVQSTTLTPGLPPRSEQLSRSGEPLTPPCSTLTGATAARLLPSSLINVTADGTRKAGLPHGWQPVPLVAPPG